ncbi:uncharacterized protein B0I36DRAFT_128162 [Microdochium trichocladiopsis]|uniref:Rhodopsin domain-containing protein n=1 Tax=Microdochium trichocladiopsis TaxID=1682393 RepID=A0A9P9BPH0_9PEZI|nr:uncharacterized protein B0I36DRAFT_128162 [Microdochium trichocladiopsis]KAH7029080.1 hypothetical protein B0I36DRAFT_128162 [Microdochium trichocladiopsis]
MVRPMYDMLLVGAGLAAPTADFMANSSVYLKCQFASTLLFWTCLWTVKACFLAFFYRLVNNLAWPRRVWIGICVFTGLTYVASVITYPLSCTSFELGQCDEPKNIQGSLISLRFSTCVDIATDVMIMILPIYLAIGLKMSLKQKISLIAVLGLGCIVTVFSVIRIIVTYTVTTQPEVSWLALWSTIESSIAVMVACLPSFKVLISQGVGSSNKSRSKYADMGGSAHQSGTGRSRFGGHASKNGTVTSKVLASRGFEDLDDTELQNMRRVAGKQNITVTQTFAVSNDRQGARGDIDWDDDDRESQDRILK